MLAAAAVVRENLLQIRDDVECEFRTIFQAAAEKSHQLNIEPLSLPRQRKIPRRFNDGDEQHAPGSAEELYRAQYIAAIDSAVTNIDTHFTSTDITVYQQLADMLTTGKANDAVISQYPELTASLQLELDFYCRQYEHTSVDRVRAVFCDMVPEVRKLFPQVSVLLRLLLVSPASSCTVERSFSPLRRMKTWLLSTMTQQRLNHVMVCHVHRTCLAACLPRDIAMEFINGSPKHAAVFLVYSRTATLQAISSMIDGVVQIVTVSSFSVVVADHLMVHAL